MMFQVLLEPFEVLQKKYSLYNVKLVGESAPAMFPEYLKELIQDRGYWSRFKDKDWLVWEMDSLQRTETSPVF